MLTESRWKPGSGVSNPGSGVSKPSGKSLRVGFSLTYFERGQLGLCQQGACPGAVVTRLRCKILSVFEGGLGFSCHPTYTSLLLLREISVRLGFCGR